MTHAANTSLSHSQREAARLAVFEETRQRRALEQQEEEASRRKARHDALVADFRHHRDAFHSWDRSCSERHQVALRAFRQRRADEASFAAAQAEAREAAKRTRTARECTETLRCLDELDFTLRRLGRDGEEEMQPLAAKPTIHRGETAMTNQEAISAIRARKEEDVRARRERLQRQYRMEAEQAKVSGQMAQQKAQEAVLERARTLADADRAAALARRLHILEKKVHQEEEAEFEAGSAARIAAEAAVVDAQVAVTAAQERQVANERFKCERGAVAVLEAEKQAEKHRGHEAHCCLLAKQLVELALQVVEHNTEQLDNKQEIYRHDAALTTSQWRRMMEDALCVEALERRRLADIAALSPSSRRKKHSFALSASLSVTSPGLANDATATHRSWGSEDTTAHSPQALASPARTLPSGSTAQPPTAGDGASAQNPLVDSASKPRDRRLSAIRFERTEAPSDGATREEQMLERIGEFLSATAMMDAEQLSSFVETAAMQVRRQPAGAALRRMPALASPPPLRAIADELVEAAEEDRVLDVRVEGPSLCAVFVSGDDLSGVRLLADASSALPDAVSTAHRHQLEIVTPDSLLAAAKAAPVSKPVAGGSNGDHALSVGAPSSKPTGKRGGKQGGAQQTVPSAGRKSTSNPASRANTPDSQAPAVSVAQLLAQKLVSQYVAMAMARLREVHPSLFPSIDEDESTSDLHLFAPELTRRLVLVGFSVTPAFFQEVGAAVAAIEPQELRKQLIVPVTIPTHHGSNRAPERRADAGAETADGAGAADHQRALKAISARLQHLREAYGEEPAPVDVSKKVVVSVSILPGVVNACSGVQVYTDDVAHVAALEGQLADPVNHPATVFHPLLCPPPAAASLRASPWQKSMSPEQLLSSLRERRTAIIQQGGALGAAIAALRVPEGGETVGSASETATALPRSHPLVVRHGDLLRADGRPLVMCNVLIDRLASLVDAASDQRLEAQEKQSTSTDARVPTPPRQAQDQPFASPSSCSGESQYFTHRLSLLTQALRENELRMAQVLRRAAEHAVEYLATTHSDPGMAEHTQAERWKFCDAQRARDVHVLGEIMGKAHALFAPCAAARVVTVAQVLVECCQQMIARSGLSLSVSSNAGAEANDGDGPRVCSIAALVQLPTLDAADRRIREVIDDAGDANAMERLLSEMLNDVAKKLRHALLREHVNAKEAAREVDARFEAVCKRVIPWFLAHQHHLDAIPTTVTQGCNMWSMRLFHAFNDVKADQRAVSRPANPIQLVAIAAAELGKDDAGPQQGRPSVEPLSDLLQLDAAEAIMMPAHVRHLTHHFMMAAPTKIAEALCDGGTASRGMLTEREFVHGFLSAQVCALSSFIPPDDETDEERRWFNHLIQQQREAADLTVERNSGLFLPPWWLSSAPAKAEDEAQLSLFDPVSLRETFAKLQRPSPSGCAGEEGCVSILEVLTSLICGHVNVTSRPLLPSAVALLKPITTPTLTEVKCIAAAIGSLGRRPIATESEWLALPWWRLCSSGFATRAVLRNLWVVLNWGKQRVRRDGDPSNTGITFHEVLPLLCADSTPLKTVEKYFAALGIAQQITAVEGVRSHQHSQYREPAARVDVAHSVITSQQTSSGTALEPRTFLALFPNVDKRDLDVMLYLAAKQGSGKASATPASHITLALLTSSHVGRLLVKNLQLGFVAVHL